jgi:hypothetical protein
MARIRGPRIQEMIFVRPLPGFVSGCSVRTEARLVVAKLTVGQQPGLRETSMRRTGYLTVVGLFDVVVVADEVSDSTGDWIWKEEENQRSGEDESVEEGIQDQMATWSGISGERSALGWWLL